MLIEADDLGDRQRRIRDRIRAAHRPGPAFAPDFEIRVEHRRAALNVARAEHRRQRLTPIHIQQSSGERRRADGLSVDEAAVERVRKIRLLSDERCSGRAAFGNCTNVHERIAAGEISGGRILRDHRVVADEDVVEEDLVREIRRIVRQRRRAARRHIDRHVADCVGVRAADARASAGNRRNADRERRPEVREDRGRNEAGQLIAVRDDDVRIAGRIRKRERAGRVIDRSAGSSCMRRDHAVHDHVVHRDALNVVAGEEEIEVEHRIRKVRPDRDVRDLRKTRRVRDGEDRVERGR